MRNLEFIAKLIEKETGRKAEVKEVYIDYGSNYKAENIIIDNEYQLFTPSQLASEITTEDVQRVIEKINRRTKLQEMLKNIK